LTNADGSGVGSVKLEQKQFLENNVSTQYVTVDGKKTYVSKTAADLDCKQLLTQRSMDMRSDSSTRMKESENGESGCGPRHPAYAKDATVGGPGKEAVVVVDCSSVEVNAITISVVLGPMGLFICVDVVELSGTEDTGDVVVVGGVSTKVDVEIDGG
jgi:hypothetical protein